MNLREINQNEANPDNNNFNMRNLINNEEDGDFSSDHFLTVSEGSSSSFMEDSGMILVYFNLKEV